MEKVRHNRFVSRHKALTVICWRISSLGLKKGDVIWISKKDLQGGIKEPIFVFVQSDEGSRTMTLRLDKLENNVEGW